MRIRRVARPAPLVSLEGMTHRKRVALFVAALAVAVYAAMWAGFRAQWGWLHGFDWWLLNAAHDVGVKHPVWVRVWAGISFWLGPDPLRLLDAAVAVLAFVRRNVRAGVLLVVCGPLNGLVTLAAKTLADRPRPSTMLVVVPQSSFPSGHAMETMAAVLALLAVVLPALHRATGAVAISVSALVLLLVGVARVALNVHHPSDVLAGWCLGYLYALLCLIVIRPKPLGTLAFR
ncbi:membrane protein [Mycobacterium simiae]|nr:membrane protein [Mycobacterium simiae]